MLEECNITVNTGLWMLCHDGSPVTVNLAKGEPKCILAFVSLEEADLCLAMRMCDGRYGLVQMTPKELWAARDIPISLLNYVGGDEALAKTLNKESL